MSKPLNVGVIGCGFMGRTHSNAYSQVNHFFQREHKPVLKACCGRPRKKDKLEEVRQGLGLRVDGDSTGESSSRGRTST